MKKSVTIKTAWITAGAIICAAIITGLFSIWKQEEQVIQTGDNNIFSKDHVEGDKIVNVGPSDDDLERIVSKLAKKFDESLSKKYSKGHIVFGIKKDGFVVPKGVVPKGIDVSWNTGKVLSISDDKVEVTLPSMIINTKRVKNGRIAENTTRLAKQVTGWALPLITLGDVSMKIEVIGIDKELIVVGLGLSARGN